MVCVTSGLTAGRGFGTSDFGHISLPAGRLLGAPLQRGKVTLLSGNGNQAVALLIVFSRHDNEWDD